MEATFLPGGGGVVGRRLLLRKSASIKPLREHLQLQKDLAVPNSLCSSRQLHISVARCHRRDPSGDKGEEGGRSTKTKRTWWSDEPPEMDTKEEEEVGVLEEVIESMWILKIFEPYGWVLPVIMSSWLAATGPKAFLMALAIPLGQSAVTFAISRLLGKKKKTKKKKNKQAKVKRRVVNRKTPSASPWKGRSRSINEIIEQVEEEGRRRKAEEGASGKVRYESWVDSNGKPSSPSSKSFGGWEELDGFRFTEQKPNPASATKESQASPQQQQLQPARKRVTSVDRKPSNLSLEESSESETPLVLRLLIAVFPFLASWTKIF
ncbi:hypothetical protein LINGRAHAP2_LOCUS23407 [Linum grandiflorum]